MLDAMEIRKRLGFDVDRLRVAAVRLEQVDELLGTLRWRLEARARNLATEAMAGATPIFEGDGRVQIWSAQAQAIAHLAARAALGEVLRSSSRLALIAAMAVSRWVAALKLLSREETSEAAIRAHIEAGRVAHRLLSMLRPHDHLRSGTGQLTSAVVVAEFAHAANHDDVAEQIEEGLFRARAARGVRSEEEAVSAASRALRAGAELLESMADRAEPGARALLAEAENVEALVASRLASALRAR